VSIPSAWKDDKIQWKVYTYGTNYNALNDNVLGRKEKVDVFIHMFNVD
jgi:hypothetical protein